MVGLMGKLGMPVILALGRKRPGGLPQPGLSRVPDHPMATY